MALNSCSVTYAIVLQKYSHRLWRANIDPARCANTKQQCFAKMTIHKRTILSNSDFKVICVWLQVLHCLHKTQLFFSQVSWILLSFPASTWSRCIAPQTLTKLRRLVPRFGIPHDPQSGPMRFTASTTSRQTSQLKSPRHIDRLKQNAACRRHAICSQQRVPLSQIATFATRRNCLPVCCGCPCYWFLVVCRCFLVLVIC